MTFDSKQSGTAIVVGGGAMTAGLLSSPMGVMDPWIIELLNAPIPEAAKRYNLSASVEVRNLLNSVNPSTPVGILGSPSFGEALGITSAGGATQT